MIRPGHSRRFIPAALKPSPHWASASKSASTSLDAYRRIVEESLLEDEEELLLLLLKKDKNKDGLAKKDIAVLKLLLNLVIITTKFLCTT